MALSWDPKDPDEVLDYDIDWSLRLDTGDTIVSSTWIMVTAGTLVIDHSLFSDTDAKVWLTGGTIGEIYFLTNRIVTAGGRTMDQTVKLKVKSK